MRKIVFRNTDKGVRTNLETGVEIVNTVRGFMVKCPTRTGFDIIRETATLREAREWATERVELMREVVAEAYAEALAEDETHILDCDYCGEEGGTHHWNSPSGAVCVAFTCEAHEARVDALRFAGNGRVTRKQVHDDRAAYAAEQRAHAEAKATRPAPKRTEHVHIILDPLVPGTRVRVLGMGVTPTGRRTYAAMSTGIYVGVRDDSDSRTGQIYYFENGEINGIPQRCFGFDTDDTRVFQVALNV